MCYMRRQIVNLAAPREYLIPQATRSIAWDMHTAQFGICISSAQKNLQLLQSWANEAGDSRFDASDHISYFQDILPSLGCFGMENCDIVKRNEHVGDDSIFNGATEKKKGINFIFDLNHG